MSQSERRSNSSTNKIELSRKSLAAVLLGASITTIVASSIIKALLRKLREQQDNAATVGKALKNSAPYGGFMQAIGNTKLIELPSLSAIAGCRILAKCEFLNPGGSSKDRIAKAIMLDAYEKGMVSRSAEDPEQQQLGPPTVVEGTSGSTGISLALAARALGLNCLVFMPDDISEDKSNLLKMFGAEVRRVKSASIASPEHYVNQARSAAAAMPPGTGFFADQFEHRANHACHYHGTGAEVWAQTDGKVDAFISGSGTGGTIAGVGRYLRERNPEVCICLADPQGSALANRVNFDILYTDEMRESTLRRHRYDTIVEGVGLCRLTHNFAQALKESCKIDIAYTISDQAAVTMSRWLLNREGLFLGSSSALNCCAALRLAKEKDLGPDKTIVLLLCDGGQRHVTKFWNDAFLRDKGLDPAVPSNPEELLAALKEN